MATITMNLDLVQEMVTNYKTKQYLSIVTNKINPMTYDAQSVHFNLDALKDFITIIEEEVAKHPEYSLRNLGIRFYYAAYPDSDLWDEPGYEDLAGMASNPSTEKYEKLHTIIAIPTAEINGVQSDFDPMDANTYDGSKPSGIGVAIMAENHGGLVPPDSPNGLWF